jgi:hypothetical protein
MSAEGFILKIFNGSLDKGEANKLLVDRTNKGSSWKRRILVEKIQNTLGTLKVGQKTVRNSSFRAAPLKRVSPRRTLDSAW